MSGKVRPGEWTAARMYPKTQVIRELIAQESLAGSPTPGTKEGGETPPRWPASLPWCIDSSFLVGWTTIRRQIPWLCCLPDRKDGKHLPESLAGMFL